MSSKLITAIHFIKPSLILTLLAGLVLGGCQTIQPFNGSTGYQRELDDSQAVIISYTLASNTDDKKIQRKLQKACAKELGLDGYKSSDIGKDVQVKILQQTEVVNSTKQSNSSTTLNTKHASFGLSTTPKLSNSGNTAALNMLEQNPANLKRVTAECLR